MIKKFIVASCFMLCLGFSLQAQGFFVELGRSYSWQGVRGPVEFYETSDSLGGNLTLRNVFQNQGDGFGIGGNVGYMFNENFGVEIGFEYFLSVPIRAKTQDFNPLLLVTADVSTQQGRLMPGVILRTDGNRLRGIARAGMLMPIFGASYLEIEIASSLFGTHTRSLTRNTGKFSGGFYGGFGGEYRFGDNIGLTLEVNAKYLRVKSLKQTILKQFDVNTGLSTMNNLNTFDIETEYVDELTTGANNPNFVNPVDPDKPQQLIGETSSYSSVGVRAGIKLYFPQKEKEAKPPKIEPIF
ncbi:MAG: outer membrane beta-barrel protein [Bacteroidota bacterium]